MSSIQDYKINQPTELFNLFCSRHFQRTEPFEIVIRIKALENNLHGQEKVILPLYPESGIITPNQWFTTGLNFRFFFAQPEHKINIYLDPNPILKFGFVVIFDPNPLIPNGAIFHEKPNQKLKNGINLEFHFNFSK